MRPIDGDNLYSVLDNIAAHLFETKSEPQCSMAQTIQYAMGIVMDQPTIAPLPSAPLTLDELREMDGEPVYVRYLGGAGEWGLVETMYGYDFTEIRFRNGLANVESEYGLISRGAKFYRHKPE